MYNSKIISLRSSKTLLEKFHYQSIFLHKLSEVVKLFFEQPKQQKLTTDNKGPIPFKELSPFALYKLLIVDTEFNAS